MFEHLQMLWISSWVQRYTNTLATVGPDFGKKWIWPTENDAMISWLRLLTTTSLYPTFTLYIIYKVLVYLKMLWIAHGCSLKLIHHKQGDQILENKLDLAKGK
jgi:hypothetical protein